MFNHAIAYVMSMFAADKNDEKGATAIEYALVIGMVSIVVIGIITVFGERLDTFVSGISFG